MKLICFADTHAGVKNYGRLDKNSGLNEREIQTLGLLNEVVEYAINNSADGVVFAGDMYHKNMPSPTLVNKVNEIMVKLSQNKIKTFVLDGNHDVSKMETTNSGLTQFATLNIPFFTHSRFYKEEIFECDNQKYKFVFLPTYHTKEEIQEYINKLDTKYPTIIIFHGSIKDAELNDWNKMESNTAIEADTFNKKNIVSVIMGHFHKHQIIKEKPLIFYTGSTNRIDFSEEKQEKGFVELNINGTDIEDFKFIKLNNAQKFKTIYINAKNMSTSNEIEQSIIDKLDSSIKNSIVRIKLDLNENIIINEKKIIEYAYNNGVYYLLKIQKILPDVKTIIEDGISNILSVQDSLKKYYKGQKREKERILLGSKIVQMIEGDE